MMMMMNTCVWLAAGRGLRMEHAGRWLLVCRACHRCQGGRGRGRLMCARACVRWQRGRAGRRGAAAHVLARRPGDERIRPVMIGSPFLGFCTHRDPMQPICLSVGPGQACVAGPAADDRARADWLTRAWACVCLGGALRAQPLAYLCLLAHYACSLSPVLLGLASLVRPLPPPPQRSRLPGSILPRRTG
jgi:hypothetical protein